MSVCVGNVVTEDDMWDVRFTLVVNNIRNIVAAHIRCAPTSVYGPVGITLFLGRSGQKNCVLTQGPTWPVAVTAERGCENE